MLGRGEKEKAGEKPFGSGENGFALNCVDDGRLGMAASGGMPFMSWDWTEFVSVVRRFRGGICGVEGITLPDGMK